MSDLVVTVPRNRWAEWLAEGDLPGAEAEYESHFFVWSNTPYIAPGERVYVVAHGRLRGYAPLVRVERMCQITPSCGCLVRAGGAVAVTIDEEIRALVTEVADAADSLSECRQFARQATMRLGQAESRFADASKRLAVLMEQLRAEGMAKGEGR